VFAELAISQKGEVICFNLTTNQSTRKSFLNVTAKNHTNKL